MAESMKGLHRTCRCAEVTNDMVGNKVTLMGWVQKARNTGGLVFVDLRDRSGIMQVIFEKFSLGDLTEEENRCWKQIDNEMLSNEMPVMLNGRMPIEKVKISSEPDLAEHPFREVEEKFYSMAEELLTFRE